MSKLTAQNLAQFTGTTCYYRISTQHLLTDGTQYLAEQAGCYWIMDAVSSHVTEISTQDWFIVVRIEVEDHQAVMRYEGGNGRELARQAIPYTDFPLRNLALYATELLSSKDNLHGNLGQNNGRVAKTQSKDSKSEATRPNKLEKVFNQLSYYCIVR